MLQFNSYAGLHYLIYITFLPLKQIEVKLLLYKNGG